MPGFEKYCSNFIQETVKIISSEEADSILKSNEIILLDTRSKKEYDISHIKGAYWVGYDNFSFKDIEYIPKNKTIITYCSIGYRSEKIGEKLISKGYKSVYNMFGGIFSWGNNGYELVNNKDLITRQIHGYDSKWSKWINSKVNKVILE